uniref:U3 small nucleolar RNA-associated protein 20 C-terminal domain-containing protein n=1 Tax=Romanomermis culicivorax TaxID=13658 RepID=A0A915I2J9_ROMCU
MLKYYLQRLRKDVEKQKLLVKIIVSILDSFHFDVKTLDVSIVPENQDKIEEPLVTNNEMIKIDENKRKIFDVINKEFIPQLQNCLVMKTSTDKAHKTMKSKVYDEDEEILRVPLALALIKLLQKLGDKYLEMNLSNILAKICQMLKSRSFDIRETTRKILCSSAQCLGPVYLPYIVKEMKEILTRGYQVHVLTFTVHVLLDAMVDKLSPGDLDPCLDELIQIFNNDLFGAIADQKEVDEITRNLKEAKSNKTLATYKILGRLVSDHRLNSIIGPLKNILEEKFSHKMITRVNDALKHIAQGLILNSNLNSEFLMIFVHNILTENVEKMNLGDESLKNSSIASSADKVENKSYRPQSCLLLDPTPPRIGLGQNTAISKSKTQGLHVLLIFACEILDNLLKNQQTMHEISAKFCSMLDPFIEILLRCLKAKQTKVVSVSMRCLNHMIKFPLQSWEKSSGPLMTQLFVLLSRFAGLGSACKGENSELLSILFKTLTTIIRELECATLSIKQLKILLTYIEADLYDSQKQTTAFSLLKAILHRKLSCPEIRQIITILEKLAIESQSDSVREQSRQVIKFYMQNYPSGLKARNVHKSLKFFCAQLQYEYESGRDSALEMLNLLINDVDENGHFKALAPFLFVHLGSLLVDDESSKIRRKTADVLKTLLKKIDDQSILNSMIQMIFDWLNGEELAHKKLAAQLLCLLAVDDKLMDANLVKKSTNACLNVLENLSIKYKLLDDEEQEEAQQKSLIDHVVYLILVFFEKLFTEQVNLIRESNLRSIINRIWQQILKLLDHPHLWVQHSTCRLIGSFLGCYKPEEIAQYSCKPSTSSDQDYLLENCRPVIKTLCLSFIQRLRMAECKEDLAEQIIKNIVFIGRCIRLISKKGDDSSTLRRQEVDSDKDYRASLKWLTVQMGRICRFEIAQYKEQNLRRNNIFKWFASLILDCDDEELDGVLPILLPNLHREMSLTTDADETLKLLSSEIVELIKSKIGVEKFFTYWSKAQSSWSEKRIERKRNVALEAVNEPEKASKRRMLKQKNKK